MKTEATQSTFTVRNDKGAVRLILGAELMNDGQMSFHHSDAYYQLLDGIANGVVPTRRKKGFSNWQTLDKLANMGLMEHRPSGTRGGLRYHTTALGKSAVELYRLHEENVNKGCEK